MTCRPARTVSVSYLSRRTFSTDKDADDYHEVTARGTKLWNFEQVKKATESDKVVLIGAYIREDGFFCPDATED